MLYENSSSIEQNSQASAKNNDTKSTDSTKHMRKRYTKAEQETHKEQIIECYNNNKSLTLLQVSLGISKAQMSNYLSELFMTNKLKANETYKDNICMLSQLAEVITNYFQAIDAKTLLKVDGEEGAVIITLAHGINN